MKVIDLLNKIANREEVPEKFKYKGETYIYRTYTFEDGDIMTGYGFEDGGWLNIWRDNLNDEVEVIEENKKIILDKLNWDKNDMKYITGEIDNESVIDIILDMQSTINEIIDYLEENK